MFQMLTKGALAKPTLGFLWFYTLGIAMLTAVLLYVSLEYDSLRAGEDVNVMCILCKIMTTEQQSLQQVAAEIPYRYLSICNLGICYKLFSAAGSVH